MKHKRLLATLLTTILVFTALSGCTRTSTPSSEGPAPSSEAPSPGSETPSDSTSQGEPDEVVMALMIASAGNSADYEMIQEEINKITIPAINTKLKIEPVPNYTEQLNLMLMGGERLDLMVVQGSLLSNYVNREQILPLTSLIDEYGTGIRENLGDYLSATTINGEVYSIPSIRDLCRGGGFNMRKDLIEKYNIDISKLTKLEDLTEVFRIIKEGEGANFYPLGIGGAKSTFIANYATYDPLDDKNGVLLNRGATDTKVVMLEETDEFKSTVSLLWDWYQKGYIEPDVATTTENYATMMQTGTIFCYPTNAKPGVNVVAEINTGYPLETVQFVDYFATTGQVNLFGWGIAQGSENPEAAMKMLNMIYSDKAVMTLLSYGIEGVHYEKKADGTLGYLEGKTQATTGWSLNTSWLMGNQFLLDHWSGEPENLWVEQKAANDNAVKSKALGFTFNNAKVANEVAAVKSVRDEYERFIEWGASDPAELLPTYIDKLKANGIEKIIQEKQSQLDAWLAAQN